jgi:hypothetical protein
MTFFNQLLLARNAQGQVESVLARQNKRLVVSFGNNPLNTQSTIFDIISSWQYRQSVRITKNPVEQGVNINDHRIQEPIELTIEVGTSNIIDPLRAVTTLDAGAIIQSVALQIVGNRIANGRIQATYSQLRNAMQNSDTFDIDTPMGLMKNFVITEIENENNADSISTFEGTIRMQEILYFDNLVENTSLVSGVGSVEIIRNALTKPLL